MVIDGDGKQKRWVVWWAYHVVVCLCPVTSPVSNFAMVYPSPFRSSLAKQAGDCLLKRRRQWSQTPRYRHPVKGPMTYCGHDKVKLMYLKRRVTSSLLALLSQERHIHPHDRQEEKPLENSKAKPCHRAAYCYPSIIGIETDSDVRGEYLPVNHIPSTSDHIGASLGTSNARPLHPGRYLFSVMFCIQDAAHSSVCGSHCMQVSKQMGLALCPRDNSTLAEYAVTMNNVTRYKEKVETGREPIMKLST